MSDYPRWRPDSNQGERSPGSAAPPTAIPRGRRRPTWFPAVAGVGATALIGIVAIGVVLATGVGSGRGHQAAGGSSGSPPSGPTTYTGMPNPCTIGASRPKQVDGATIKGPNDEDHQRSCSWAIFDSDRAVYLQVGILMSSGAGNPIVEARNAFANDRTFAASPDDADKEPAGFSGNEDAQQPQAIPGLGDEAFSAKFTNDVSYGSANHPKLYHLGGAWVEARAANVIVSVRWGGATYQGVSSGDKIYTGTNDDYSTTDKQARTVVKTLLGKLS